MGQSQHMKTKLPKSFKDLLKQGEDDGFLVQDDILLVCPEPEHSIEEIDEFFSESFQKGIYIFESMSSREEGEGGRSAEEIEKAIAIAQSADLFVIVGTSMVVHPAASLLLAVPVDVQTVYIDTNPDVEEGINLLVIKDKATAGVRILVEECLPY